MLPEVKVTLAVRDGPGLAVAVTLTEPSPVPEAAERVSHVWSEAAVYAPLAVTVRGFVSPAAVKSSEAGLTVTQLSVMVPKFFHTFAA